jgi:hypothetical protein
VREEVEGGDALGHASRVVHLDREMDDAVAQPDLLGALAGGTEKHLGCRRVGILLQEVMLDQPDAVEPKPVGELDLLEGIGQQLSFVAGPPRPGQLMLVEQAKAHGASSSAAA